MTNDSSQNTGQEKQEQGAASRAGHPETKPGSEKISDHIKHAVQEAYKVVDAYVQEGKDAATLIQQGTYTNDVLMGEIANLTKQWVTLVKELGVTGMKIVSIIVQDTRLVPPESGTTTPGVAPLSQMAVRVRSKKPVQIHHDLDTAPPPFIPFVSTLYSEDPSLSPLTGAKFVLGADRPPVLVVEIPDDHPAGTYTGSIVDENKKKRGSISVTVLQYT